MPLEIIGPGFGRTGTNSLKLALEHLGFGPCHHMFEINADAPEQVDHWEAIADGQVPDWDAVFAGFRSQLDWPACRYWRELAAHFPDAKVILSVRSPDGWLKSFKSTILPYMKDPAQHDDPIRQRKSAMARKVVAEHTFGGRLDDAHLLEVYSEHIAEVQRTIAADRLLTFDVRQGWGPLSDFLGVPVPDTEFPRTNSTRDFQDIVAAAHQ